MISITALIKCSKEVTTDQGNTYYKMSHWFQVSPDGEDIIVYGKMPDDLSEFIVRAGLGQPNPQIKNPKE